MKITIELTGTLELAALESALEMYEAYTEDPPPCQTERERLECKAGKALLARVRGAK
jgi:hypothetical protein